MLKAESNYGCVIENKLYFGNAILARDEPALEKLNISSIVDLINYSDPQKEIKHSPQFSVFHLSIEDAPTNTIDWCEQVSSFIESEIKNNKAVYVHCAQGISRSTTSILHYLMTREHKPLKESFDYLKSIRKVVSPIYGFMKGLCELEFKLFNKSTFSPEEYSILCYKEVLPQIDIEEIKKVYEESKKEVEKDKGVWDKRKKDEKIEPVGYLCYEKLFEKYGKDNFIKRYGCTPHHPFD